MKALITGITGFLGNKSVDLLKQQFEIIGIKGQTSKTLADKAIKLYDIDSLDLINERPDIALMCHAAVSSGNVRVDNENLYKANVQFTERMVNLFPNAYFLYISSVSVYGSSNKEPIDESSLLYPESEYAVSKLWGEKISSSTGNFGILRLPSLYGIGMKDNTVLPTYVNQALRQNKIEVWGNGERKQNYLYINDVVKYIKSMMLNKSQGIHLATSGKELSNLELAETISSITGSEIVFKGTDNASSKSYNNKITKDKLNITTEMLISEGLKEYISWERKQF